MNKAQIIILFLILLILGGWLFYPKDCMIQNRNENQVDWTCTCIGFEVKDKSKLSDKTEVKCWGINWNHHCYTYNDELKTDCQHKKLEPPCC